MLLIILAYLGGVITILSPCILPVLPFVFTRTGMPFRSSGLPLLTGMAVTFALVASIATIGGAWVVRANEYGRVLALVLLAIFGLMLLWEGLAERITRPLVQLGGRLSSEAGSGTTPSFMLGIATGLLWAPCAGPILGLLLTGAALQGANAQTSLLLLAYAAGAATSLGLALLAGGRLFALMKRSLGTEAWLRRGLGMLVLLGVAAIALDADRKILAPLSVANTSRWEQALLDSLHPAMAAAAPVTNGLLELKGATAWLNSPPLNAAALNGKVVLVDFWTYSCVNCLRTLPYLRAWDEKYRAQGLVIIGVHAPEFAFERSQANVEKALRDLHINYPVALDNDFAIWGSFNNEYWPAHYLFDVHGKLRQQHFGEGNYEETEHAIQQLLAEKSGANTVQENIANTVQVALEGAAVPGKPESQSPETYLGYARASNFIMANGLAQDQEQRYAIQGKLALNQWGLSGSWIVGAQQATLNQPHGRIVFRFQARDVNLVLGTADGKPLQFRVTVDGKPVGANHGTDTDEQGNGMIAGNRLYQLVRQADNISERTFEIEFLEAGAQAFAFTFG